MMTKIEATVPLRAPGLEFAVPADIVVTVDGFVEMSFDHLPAEERLVELLRSGKLLEIQLTFVSSD